MHNLHSMLRRQLKRVGCEDASAPPTGDGWAELLERISRAYTDADGDRYTLERSLDVSSREMQTLLARLSGEHDRTQAVLTAIADGLCHTDRDWKIQLLNTEAEKMLGWSNEDALGRDLFEVLKVRPVSGDKPFDCDSLRVVVQEGGRYRSEDNLLVRRDDTTFSASLVFNPMLKKGDGTMVGVVLAFSDISVRKRVEHDLQEARLAAESANRAKSEFLANMSHEIRTPMNGVLGMIELLLGTNLSPVQRDYAETVRNSAEALLTIINDILDFSKIEAGKYDLESIEFDVRQALEEVAVLLAEPAHKKGLELCCLIQHDVPRLLRGDPGRLRQVLTNLVGNAVKFTEKGEVVIRASVEVDRQNDVLLRIEVEDTGIGISEEGKKRLFASFSQVDASTTRKYGGTGLGLAISKKLTELMGGAIGVDSVPGKGSTFHFSVRLDKVVLPHSDENAPEVNLRGMRVLIVDDNETNRKLLRLLIHNWGMTCDVCEDAYRSLAHLYQGVTTNQPYDFAIIDMQMPGMDGLELARIIRGDPRFAGLPLIMLTSLGERGFADKARQSGISAYLSKPVRQSQLFDCLMATLSMPGARIDIDGKPAEPVMITRHTLAAQKPQSAPMVLIVEDNLVNQKVLVGLLRQLGHRADVANNGREAVAALLHTHYGLVLMDCIMPELDGFEATAEIRGRELLTGRRVPIIALSASNLEEDRRRALSAGMDDFLSKPLRTEDLERAINKWLSHADSHGHGTVVGIEPTPPPPRGRSPSSISSNPAEKPLVLVAEDNPINQRVAFAILAQLGYRAEVVSTGMEALKSLESKDYDAILMDCQMPEMDGYEATAEIRYREGMTRHTPIIAMTANAMQGDRERALASGMDDYLAKPVRPAELSAILQRHINPGADYVPSGASGSSLPLAHAIRREPLDTKIVEGLRNLVQDGGEFFRELVTTYLSDLPTQIHGLRLAVTACDARHIRECSHAIKGASTNMGAVTLSNQCGDLEEKARNGDLVDAFRLLSKIEREVVRVTTAFRSLITQDPAARNT